MIRFVKRLIKRALGFSLPNRTIDWRKTLTFNYFAFGLKGLKILPVYIYKNTRIYHHGIGKINIHCPWRRGMVRIGQYDYKTQGETRFLNRGVIDIYGAVEILGCCILEIDGNLVLHNAVRIGDGTLLVVRDKVIIHEQTRFGFHCFIMDSDEHFSLDVNNSKVYRNTKPIEIGAYNWIANKTVVKKGVKTPDYLIVASANALMTKDYTDVPPYSIMGGSPAKLLKSGVRRIYNIENEAILHKYFIENKEVNAYDVTLTESETFDDYCKQTGDSFSI